MAARSGDTVVARALEESDDSGDDALCVFVTGFTKKGMTDGGRTVAGDRHQPGLDRGCFRRRHPLRPAAGDRVDRIDNYSGATRYHATTTAVGGAALADTGGSFNSGDDLTTDSVTQLSPNPS